MKNTFFQFLFFYCIFKIAILLLFVQLHFSLFEEGLSIYTPFERKNLLILILLISRSLNCAFRNVAIFVALKKGLLTKCSKKHSFSSSMIFFLPDPGWRLMSPVSFSCLLFLLIVLSERPRVSNCAIFEIDIPISFRVENSWSFCFIFGSCWSCLSTSSWCLSPSDSCKSINWLNEMKMNFSSSWLGLSRMQAQAVFHDQSVLILLKWSYCQSLNRDSAILL